MQEASGARLSKVGMMTVGTQTLDEGVKSNKSSRVTMNGCDASCSCQHGCCKMHIDAT